MGEEDVCGKVVEQIGIWICGVAEWTGEKGGRAEPEVDLPGSGSGAKLSVE
jgi:hypothetical protein